MLFLLTGECQTGKTRWLEALVGRLAEEGVESYGVIAPGVWVSSSSANANEQGFEKLGIDNVLLPEGERIPFAKRRDLAIRDGLFQGDSQSEQLALGWHIFDDAIDEVNRHFDVLARMAGTDYAPGACPMVESANAQANHGLRDGGDAVEGGRAPCVSPSLLVVDELGRLELAQGTGLTSAVRLLDQGPSAAFPHALAVVRGALLPLAEDRFADAWPQILTIGPSRDVEEKVLEAFGRK